MTGKWKRRNETTQNRHHRRHELEVNLDTLSTHFSANDYAWHSIKQRAVLSFRIHEKTYKLNNTWGFLRVKPWWWNSYRHLKPAYLRQRENDPQGMFVDAEESSKGNVARLGSAAQGNQRLDLGHHGTRQCRRNENLVSLSHTQHTSVSCPPISDLLLHFIWDDSQCTNQMLFFKKKKKSMCMWMRVSLEARTGCQTPWDWRCTWLKIAQGGCWGRDSGPLWEQMCS